MIDFELTEEQLMIKEAARDFAEKELASGAAETREGAISAEQVRKWPPRLHGHDDPHG